ncbi:histidine kinase [Klebsormidium nitens]|uniref:histidine kinase n=1 Tax=Klebsormidium nitens TaxID=105231 RepID=A0A1Y1IM10_KLENI|nr:histidine kinase [Klebsormidium nitens]|eukprot:GAQ91910.1 histidine kinase [Klebsormidium nitens]
MQSDDVILQPIGESSAYGQGSESSPYTSTLSKHWAGILKAWITCGLIMAAVIGWQLYRRAEAGRLQWFHQECTNRAQVLEGEIQASLYSTGAFHGFVQTLPTFNEETFHTYVRHTNWTRPQTYAVIFLERVLHAQRKAVEERIGHDFQMFAPDLNRYMPAKNASEYAVLCFDPMISREYIYFDFSSLPMHKVAIETTRDTNEMVFSAPSRARGWAKFVAWRAVYTNGIDIQNATVEERRAACRGYVGSVYSFKQLFAEALQKFGNNAAILVHGYDVTPDVRAEQGIIFTSLDGGEIPDDAAARTTQYEFVVSFERGFRQYELRCKDMSGSRGHNVQGALGWAGLIVIIVLLVGVIFGLVMKRMQAVELHVEEMRLAKIAAEAADRAKSSFIASVSHEIRTPMNGMIGMTSLLMETNLDATQLDYVRTAQASGRALVELVSDVLDLSKIEAGHMDIEAVCFDPRGEVDDVLSLFADKARLKQLHLAGLVGDAVPDLLVGDPNRLRQVLINLVGNAIKFTKHGSVFLCINLALPQALKDDPPHAAGVRRRSFQKPPVQWLDRTPSQVLDRDAQTVALDYPMLSLRPESRLNSAAAITTYKEVGRRALEVAEQTGRVRLVVSCEDTGVGIAPHVQPRLFKPFLQADSSTSREYGGTGIGLSISEKLVRLMGGSIRAWSRYGHGTVFQFDVQLKMPGAKDRAALSPNSRAGELRRNLEGLRVLVVDPNPVYAEIVCSCVIRLGMLAHVEKSAEAALQAAKAAAHAGQPFRLLFLCAPAALAPDVRTSTEDALNPEAAVPSIATRQPDDSIVTRLRSRTRRDIDLTPVRMSRNSAGERRASADSLGAAARARRRASAGDEAPGSSERHVALPPEALALADGVKGSPELRGLLLLAVVAEGEKLEAALKARGFAGAVVAPLRWQSVQAAVRQALGMAANQRADSAGRSKVQLEKWLRGKKVMVVDDTLINRRVASAMLARYGCSVLSLSSGQEAIEYLEKHWRDGEGEAIDIIFMDVQMPLLSGYETTRIIREKERQYCKCQTELGGAGPSSVRRRKRSQGETASGEIEEITPEGLGVVGTERVGCSGSCQYGRIPVCAVTADVMKGTRERCMEAGMTDYLPKPLDQKHLRASLGKVFGLPEERDAETTSPQT